MKLSPWRHIRPLLVTVAMPLLLAACGGGHSPTASSGADSDDLSLVDDDGAERQDGDGSTIAPGEPNPSTPVTSVEALVAKLAEMGVEATYQGQSLERSFFFPAAHLVNINGQDVRVFAYDSVEALEEDAEKISPDGSTLDLTSVLWITAPRFYARGTFLVLYVGVDAEIVEALESIFGSPFAGEGALTPDVVIDPGTSGEAPQDPALIVVGSPEELERLAAYLPEADLSDEVRAADLSQNWIVAVFRGAMPTAGYRIEIESVRLDAEGQVIVEVSLGGPGIDELVAQVITYPVDVKVIARQGLQDPSDVEWSMRTGGGAVLPAADGIPSDPLPTEPDDEPVRLPDIRGAITELETYAEGESASVLLRILVEGAGTDDTVFDKAWVEIVAATRISFDGESFAPPTLDDLTPGRRVSVIFIGPVRESYPVQAVAGQVMIYR
jgi:hypothetical protein